MSAPSLSSDAVVAPSLEQRGGWGLVWALAFAQLVSWGILYYGFSLFVVPMEEELHWSRTGLNGALSVGLLVAGLCGYPVGHWIDRHGGRWLMTAGSALGAVLLLGWARVGSVFLFYAIWVGIGAAMAANLYDPVFAVVTRSFPKSFRTKIMALTLIGGFASTVFVPLTQVLIDAFGWRPALVWLALILAVCCVPIHGFLLRDGPAASLTEEARAAIREADDAAFRRAMRHPVFWALSLCFTAYNVAFAAVTFHIIPLLTEREVPTATILATIAVIGPAQVAGRIALMALGRHASTPVVGRITVLVLPASILPLLLFPTSPPALFLFAAAYGAANGVMTIIRGTAVPDLLWREGYGAISGALGLPATVSRAAAPFVAALIWRLAGYDAVLWAVILSALVAAAAFWVAAAWRAPRG